ncbi:hypothetical protein LCGC14_1784630 [marine sediment metagenome]|uniref:Uncharacterized protein n=1 Tax=marine sediment metagenome TaxID=412755 RepID=A0A0F9GUC0_9ZZZZ
MFYPNHKLDNTVHLGQGELVCRSLGISSDSLSSLVNTQTDSAYDVNHPDMSRAMPSHRPA